MYCQPDRCTVGIFWHLKKISLENNVNASIFMAFQLFKVHYIALFNKKECTAIKLKPKSAMKCTCEFVFWF